MNTKVKEVVRAIIEFLKKVWDLKLEAKIGMVLLIPPIYSVILFVLNILGAKIGLDFVPEDWHAIEFYHPGILDDIMRSGFSSSATSAFPIYLGLMAVAGAYLIKGNLKRKK